MLQLQLIQHTDGDSNHESTSLVPRPRREGKSSLVPLHAHAPTTPTKHGAPSIILVPFLTNHIAALEIDKSLINPVWRLINTYQPPSEAIFNALCMRKRVTVLILCVCVCLEFADFISTL